MKAIERILFVRTDRIGDVLLNLPAVRVLRQTFPKSWITLLLDRSLRGLLDGHPDVDEVMYVDAVALKQSSRARGELRRKMQSASFDLAILSNPDKWMHFLTFRAGISRRVGYGRKWGFFLTRRMVDQKAYSGRHEIESNLELVGLVSDKVWDGKLFLPVNDKALSRVEAFLGQVQKNGEAVILHPGTSDPAKRWAPERFAEVSDFLQKNKGLFTILIGGLEEASTAEAVIKNLKIPSINWTGSLNLAELAALLSHPRTKLLISSDSGPVHIAWIQGTPVVALYSKDSSGSDPKRWGPRHPKSEVVHKPMVLISSSEVCELAVKVLAKK